MGLPEQRTSKVVKITIEPLLDSGTGAKFNLRDRNNITNSKKYGAFVCYKAEDN
jgi:hypothetical protein